MAIQFVERGEREIERELTIAVFCMFGPQEVPRKKRGPNFTHRDRNCEREGKSSTRGGKKFHTKGRVV